MGLGGHLAVFSLPCMGIDLVVKVHCEYSSEREFQIASQEQGRCREAGSEGSWRQNRGPTDRNRIQGMHDG